MRGFALILLLAAIALGCKEQPKPFDLREFISTATDGHFRGVNLGETAERVKGKEKGSPSDEKEDELTYRVDIPDSDTAYFEVVYTFEKLALVEIQVNVFMFDYEATGKLFNDFKAYFDGIYGESTSDSGYTSLQTISPRKTDINIALIDESEDYGYSLLSITINEEVLSS